MAFREAHAAGIEHLNDRGVGRDEPVSTGLDWVPMGERLRRGYGNSADNRPVVTTETVLPSICERRTIREKAHESSQPALTFVGGDCPTGEGVAAETHHTSREGRAIEDREVALDIIGA